MRKRRKYRKEFYSFESEALFSPESLFFWASVVVTVIGILLIYGFLT